MPKPKKTKNENLITLSTNNPAKPGRCSKQCPDQAPSTKVVTTFCALRCSFGQAAMSAYEALEDNPFEGELPAEHVGPLLGYVEGVVRWMVRNDLHRINGLTNPWYAMGLALGSRYGINTARKINEFAFSEMDNLESIGVLDSAKELPVTAFAGFVRSDGTKN